jgi:hypothetical protein
MSDVVVRIGRWMAVHIREEGEEMLEARAVDSLVCME